MSDAFTLQLPPPSVCSSHSKKTPTSHEKRQTHFPPPEFWIFVKKTLPSHKSQRNAVWSVQRKAVGTTKRPPALHDAKRRAEVLERKKKDPRH
jgi:hypothetical protein